MIKVKWLTSSAPEGSQRVRELVLKWCGDLVFTKIDERNGSSVYAAHVSSNENEWKYIIVHIDSILPKIGDVRPLSFLPWFKLETRTLDKDLGLSPQAFSMEMRRELQIPILLGKKGIYARGLPLRIQTELTQGLSFQRALTRFDSTFLIEA